MSVYVFLGVLAGAAHLFTGLSVLLIDPRSRLHRAAALTCLCFAIWAIGNAFFLAAPDKEAAWFWQRAGAPGWTLFPGFALAMFLLIAHKDRLLTNPWVLTAVFAPGGIFLWRTLTGVTVTSDVAPPSRSPCRQFRPCRRKPAMRPVRSWASRCSAMHEGRTLGNAVLRGGLR